MRLRGLAAVLSGLALAACVVATNDRDRESPIPGRAGSSGNGGTAGSAGSSGGGTAGSAGSAGSSDAGSDVGSSGNADAAADSTTDGTGGTAGDAGIGDGAAGADAGSTDGGGTGGSAGDGGDPTLGIQCNAIISACPGVAFAQCQLYLGGMTASARAFMVTCMSSGCNLANCAQNL